MQKLTRRVVVAGLVAGLAGCSSKFATYRGPEVTKLQVFKERRVLQVFHGTRLLEQYPVDLGFGATGHKEFEGDGRTPEGRYRIDRRNPNSSFYLSLGISYPNARDVALRQNTRQEPVTSVHQILPLRS